MEAAARSKHQAWPALLRLYMAAVAVVMASWGGRAAAASAVQEMRRGFTAAQDPSYSQFQPVLTDSTGAFSLGFLCVNSTLLDLAVIHLPSSVPLWRAIPDNHAPWSAAASLSFDGGLVLTDRTSNAVLWSTASTGAEAGDRAVLLSTSNLQIQSSGGGGGGGSNVAVWQSFDFPSDTIVQDQNFTSAAALVSSDRRFSMRLGANYIALFIEPPPSSSGGVAAAMYWKHTALEAKAQIVPGGGPTYARVDPEGYLGMYQKEGPPADVLSFDTFNRGVHGLRRMTLERDGNLRAYYCDRSTWVLDYTAITEPCELPTTCGGYRVCSPAAPASDRCACLANATDGSGCVAGDASGGLCGSTGGEVGGLYWAVRTSGVEPKNKELVELAMAASAETCEALCARNCSCWGAVYSNGTGYCYLMDYPAQMLVEGGERKLGYFKVRSVGARGDQGGGGRAHGAKTALLAVGIVVVAAAAGFGAYRVWELRKRVGADGRRDDEGLAPGPYKNLGSFSSVELSSLDSFRR